MSESWLRVSVSPNSLQPILSKDVIYFSACSESTHKSVAPHSDNESEQYCLITICLQPLENLPASDPAPPVDGQSDGVLAPIDPFPFSPLPPSGPPDEIAISSAMKYAEGVVNEMTNPGGLSALENAADAMGTTSGGFSIVLQLVANLADAKLAGFLSEVSLRSTCIENYCHLIGTNSDIR